jgi:hypothetical protein
MEVSYWLYGDDFNKHSDTLDTEKPIEVPVMDQREKVWQKAKVTLSRSPVAGAELAGLLGPYGEPYDQGKFYVKIVEMLPEEEEE